VADPTEPQLRDAIHALAAALAELGAPHMLIGGIAVIPRGTVRQTNDVDATIWAEGRDLDALLGVLGRHDIVGRIDDAAQFARDHQVLLLRHAPSGTPMELSLAWFEATALQRAEPLDRMTRTGGRIRRVCVAAASRLCARPRARAPRAGGRQLAEFVRAKRREPPQMNTD
jgi:hypothetical protein